MELGLGCVSANFCSVVVSGGVTCSIAVVVVVEVVVDVVVVVVVVVVTTVTDVVVAGVDRVTASNVDVRNVEALVSSTGFSVVIISFSSFLSPKEAFLFCLFN